MNVMRQTACLDVNPIAVNNFVALFNCTPAGWSSDLMKLRPTTVRYVGSGSMLCLCDHVNMVKNS